MYFNLLVKGNNPPIFQCEYENLNILYSYGKEVFNNMYIENKGCIITGNGTILNGEAANHFKSKSKSFVDKFTLLYTELLDEELNGLKLLLFEDKFE